MTLTQARKSWTFTTKPKYKCQKPARISRPSQKYDDNHCALKLRAIRVRPRFSYRPVRERGTRSHHRELDTAVKPRYDTGVGQAAV